MTEYGILQRDFLADVLNPLYKLFQLNRRKGRGEFNLVLSFLTLFLSSERDRVWNWCHHHTRSDFPTKRQSFAHKDKLSLCAARAKLPYCHRRSFSMDTEVHHLLPYFQHSWSILLGIDANTPCLSY